jgi:hypothetical protein
MRLHGRLRLVLVTAALAGSGLTARATDAPARPDIAELIARVGDRIATYYKRAQEIVCIERSTVMPIGRDWTVQGFARTVESEVRVELEATNGSTVPDAQVTREVRRINGRLPRERDKTDRAGCTDPTPVSPEPLAFLLPAHRDEYKFTAVRDGRERDRTAYVIEFASAERSGHPELIEDERGHDECFDWKGPVAIAGRAWIDAATYDVLRLDRHVIGPTDVRVPQKLQRKYHFDQWMTLERDDQSLRYKEVSFSDPAETVLLPESTESMTVFRGGLQSMRRSEAFSDYRRFLTDTRIIKGVR